MDELKPCPFCDKLPAVEDTPDGEYITCKTPFCPAEDCYFSGTAAGWNRRPVTVSEGEAEKLLRGSIATLESECEQLNDKVIKQHAMIEALASMCRRFLYAVKRDGRDHLAHQCVELLKKHDLGGSVLRTDAYLKGKP